MDLNLLVASAASGSDRQPPARHIEKDCQGVEHRPIGGTLYRRCGHADDERPISYARDGRPRRAGYDADGEQYAASRINETDACRNTAHVGTCPDSVYTRREVRWR